MNRDENLRQKLLSLGRLFADHYFRAELITTREVAPPKPVIFAVNHSGMNFPWDCFILYVRLMEKFGPDYKLVPLSAPALFRSRILHPFAIGRFWSLFCREANYANFASLAAEGANILVNPEGVAGIAKGFNHRYRLQKFSSSFVRVALQFDRDIVPIYTVNGEYLNPFAYKIEMLNCLVQRWGIPFFAIGLMTPLYLLFPFAIYIALPARLRYVMGEKINLTGWCAKPRGEMTVDEIRDLTLRVQGHMQAELNAFAAEHGRRKFAMGELWQSIRSLGFRAWRLLPVAWPFVFHNIESGDDSLVQRAKSWAMALTLISPLIGWPIFLIYLVFSSKPSRTGETNETRNHSGVGADSTLGVRRLNAG